LTAKYEKEEKMKIIKETLDNGLTVLLSSMPAAKTITAIFACRAGRKYETSENHGIAHFLEHAMFKGTSKRPAAFDIFKEIDAKGGDSNAGTGEEMVNYWVKFPYQHIELACDIISDIILNSKFEEGEIEKEKGVIIQELRGYQDTSDEYAGMIAWPKLLYGDQPAGRCCVGTEETIKAMRREHFADFLRNLYTAENSVFCLAGRMKNAEEALRLAASYFEPIEKDGPAISKLPVIVSQKEPALFLEPREIQQSNIILGVRSYDIRNPKKTALFILDVMLGGSMSSRLFTEIREKRSLAYRVYTFTDMQSDTGNFGTVAGVDKDRVFEAVSAIMNEYRKICAERVPQEELQRVKDSIIGSLQMSLESTQSLAHYLASKFIAENKIFSPSESIKKIKAVTAEDVQAVAQEIFVNKGLNLAIVGPHAGMEEEFLKILKF